MLQIKRTKINLNKSLNKSEERERARGEIVKGEERVLEGRDEKSDSLTLKRCLLALIG